MNIRIRFQVIICIILIYSFCACNHRQLSNNDKSDVEIILCKSIIRVNENQKVSPQYMFFNCLIKNNTNDTLNWHYLGFNKGYFGEPSDNYVSKAYLRLRTKDSLRLYQESYESNESVNINPNDSLQILLSLDDFWNNPKYVEKKCFDSIESLIEDIVYYSKDTTFIICKSPNYKYSIYSSDFFEESEGSKSTIIWEDLH